VKIHQISYGLIPGDAISNQVLEIDRRLRDWGLEADIFAQHVATELADRVRPDREYIDHLRDSEDLLIYHYGIYSPNMRYFRATKGRRILVYHNITPARYFRGWDRDQELLCDAGRRTLLNLAECEHALADSEYNRLELVEAGLPEERTDVLPIFLSQAHFESNPVVESLMKAIRQTGTTNFLTVGRVAPNKAMEDVIRIFAVYHRAINPNSRLYIVGSRYLPKYDAALDALVTSLDLEDAIVFTGLLTDFSRLKTYYQAADIYLHASHHEGFCVPLIESMYFGLPILARRAAAVPETLGTSGILFNRLGYEEVAEMAHLLITDEALRAQIVHRQRERLQHFAPSRVEAQLKEILVRLRILSSGA
jgi:glycosyltransferase involved in cell wall biosynthesis